MKSLTLAMLLTGALGASAHAGTTLRLATPAPDGSAWAREFRAFGRDVAAQSKDGLKVKWYFSGLAGDDLEVADRIARGQLDGMAGVLLCPRLAPTMRVFRMQGLFNSRAEQGYVRTQLQPTISEEFRRAGFVYLGGPEMGPDVYFTRTPVHHFADLRRLKLWRWQLDNVEILLSKEMGLQIAPFRLEEAAHAYDRGDIDGFIAIPSAALAFQWSSRARYFYNPRNAFMSGCFIVANRTFDRLSLSDQEVLRNASAKAMVRVTDTGTQVDTMLLKTLFERQGLRRMPVAVGFQAELNRITQKVMHQLGPQLVPPELLDHVRELIEMWRAQHPHDEAP